MTIEEREQLRATYVQELVALGYEEPDAQFAVRLYFGESLGDVVADPPLTAEEYRAMGLDRDFLFRARETHAARPRRDNTRG